MTVVLINAFEVPEAKDAFLTFWERAADLLRRQAGFVGTKLHRAISPEPHYRFVNVAEWESPQHFQDAIGSEDFRHLSADAPHPTRRSTKSCGTLSRSWRHRDEPRTAAEAAASSPPRSGCRGHHLRLRPDQCRHCRPRSVGSSTGTRGDRLDHVASGPHAPNPAATPAHYRAGGSLSESLEASQR